MKANLFVITVLTLMNLPAAQGHEDSVEDKPRLQAHGDEPRKPNILFIVANDK
jgi:hypothetical protein